MQERLGVLVNVALSGVATQLSALAAQNNVTMTINGSVCCFRS